MPRFSFQIDLDHPRPERTLYFPRRPGRGAREDAVTDYSGVEGWHPLAKNSRHSVRWRGYVGTFIAEQLKLDISKGAWHVDDWPQGYRLWLKERRKPSRTNRADVYLLGFGGKARFESPQEFSFHAVWLYVDEYHDTRECECTLDTGRPQGVINAIWLQTNAPRRQTSTGPSGDGRGGSGGVSTRRDVDLQIEDIIAPRSDLFDPGPKLTHWIPCKRSLLDGPPDDSEQLESSSEERGRLRESLPFKNMELVWIKIPSIPAPTGSDPINLWPALIIDGWSAGPAGRHQYEVQLLGVGSKCNVFEGSVFPHQIKPLRRRRTSTGPRSLPGSVTSAEDIRRFHPLPLSSDSAAASNALPRTYANAAGPLQLARTIAQDIAAQFSVMGQHVGEAQEPNEPRLYKWAWMGPQRIEAGDLVRLVPTREKLAELGFPIEPVGESNGTAPMCLFVQVTSIARNEDGEAGFVGHLLELAPGRTEGRVEVPGLSLLPHPPAQYRFNLLTSPASPGFFKFFWVAGRYEDVILQSEEHRNFIENNLLGKQHLTYWSVQYRRGKELSQNVKYALSLAGLGPGTWNAITYDPVTVTGRQAGIQHAVKAARRVYFGDADEEESMISGSESEDEEMD